MPFSSVSASTSFAISRELPFPLHKNQETVLRTLYFTLAFCRGIPANCLALNRTATRAVSLLFPSPSRTTSLKSSRFFTVTSKVGRRYSSKETVVQEDTQLFPVMETCPRPFLNSFGRENSKEACPISLVVMESLKRDSWLASKISTFSLFPATT